MCGHCSQNRPLPGFGSNICSAGRTKAGSRDNICSARRPRTGFGCIDPDQTYLTDDEKAVLLKNPFFFDAAGAPVAGEWQMIARYNRRDGYIVRQQHTKTGARQWIQTVANGTSVITFNEVAETGGYFHLKRTGGTTTFELKIPVAGGASQILTREKPAWSPFENFDKVK